MTTPDSENWKQECVSAKQGSGRRTITWNIGVSPMELKDFIMVNQK